MSHNVVKSATRARMAETGEPYSVARRAILRQFLRGQQPAPDENKESTAGDPIADAPPAG